VSKEAKQSKRTFTSVVRWPYQDAIAFALKTHDYHMELASRGHSKDFHLKQANRMKSWIIDMKDYILKLENELNV
jgi:hypothetical protein|tara:strand:- start:937 stop:1161 length:225 start_codon:yes stop_codon:yes gene_type:complete